jgi:hypothetical protein
MEDERVLSPSKIGEMVRTRVIRRHPDDGDLAQEITEAIVAALCPICQRCRSVRVPLGAINQLCGPCTCEVASGDPIGTITR